MTFSIAIRSGGEWPEADCLAPMAAGITPQRVDITLWADLEEAITASVIGKAQAIDNGASGLLLPIRQQFAQLLVQHRLPAIDLNPLHAEAGVLMSYGQKGGQRQLSRRAASYVDKILKGARPGDLPVEQPTIFDFVVNVKTAQALGLTIPPDLASQVTEWIQ